MLDGNRTALVVGGDRTLLREPADSAPLVARLAPGVIARLIECDGMWCRIEAQGYRGWLKRDEFWGSYPKEPIE
jgi:SH3-like domain-containing protein